MMLSYYGHTLHAKAPRDIGMIPLHPDGQLEASLRMVRHGGENGDAGPFLSIM